MHSADELKQLVKKLWRENGDFSGAFGGIDTMANEIYWRTGISVPTRLIEEALHEDATYVTQVQIRRHVDTRHFSTISYFGELVQFDSGKMKTK